MLGSFKYSTSTCNLGTVRLILLNELISNVSFIEIMRCIYQFPLQKILKSLEMAVFTFS
jgi:hypothetical protein